MGKELKFGEGAGVRGILSPACRCSDTPPLSGDSDSSTLENEVAGVGDTGYPALNPPFPFLPPPSGDSASSTFEHAAMSAGGSRGTAACLLTISNSIKEFGKTAEAWQV